jgi:outer membrane lipoprotein-sorting protein
MKKKIIIILVMAAIIFLIFFLTFYYKLLNSGNNMSNKSLEEITEYILNINSYELVAEINVESNKNNNKYVVKQTYLKEQKLYKQETIEPEEALRINLYL